MSANLHATEKVARMAALDELRVIHKRLTDAKTFPADGISFIKWQLFGATKEAIGVPNENGNNENGNLIRLHVRPYITGDQRGHFLIQKSSIVLRFHVEPSGRITEFDKRGAVETSGAAA